MSIIQVNTITLIHVAHSGKLFFPSHFSLLSYVSGFWHIHAKTPRGIVVNLLSISSAKPHLSSGEFEGGLVTLRLGKSALWRKIATCLSEVCNGASFAFFFMPLADFPSLRVTYPPELNPKRDAASRVPFQRLESSPSGQEMTEQGTFSDNFG